MGQLLLDVFCRVVEGQPGSGGAAGYRGSDQGRATANPSRFLERDLPLHGRHGISLGVEPHGQRRSAVTTAVAPLRWVGVWLYTWVTPGRTRKAHQPVAGEPQ